MPSKNILKIYRPNSFYHLYNRGVEKRLIFPQETDYSVFLSSLKDYLSIRNEFELRKQLTNPKTNYKEKEKIANLLRLNNFSGELSLLAFALLPNHFHLLVRQKSSNIIIKFMNSMITRNSMYINKKYKRVGPLFQGVYKGVLVESEIQLKHLSRYIHQQAIFSKRGQRLHKPFPSSYPNYLGKIIQPWIKTDEILQYFKGGKEAYRKFVENRAIDEESNFIIQNISLER